MPPEVPTLKVGDPDTKQGKTAASAGQAWVIAVVMLVSCTGTTAPSTSPPTTAWSAAPSITEHLVAPSMPEQPIATVISATRVRLSGCRNPQTAAWGHSTIGCNGSLGGTTYVCPPGGEAYTVWGTDIYTNDSSVCTAAVHAGLITFEDGGEVAIEMRDGESSYLGTTANGVTTMDYGRWPSSFVFVDR